MQSITTEIDIAASPGTVWGILTDFASYGEWNPFITAIEGSPAVGERIAAVMRLPGGKPMAFKPRLTAVEPGRLLQWLGSLGVKGLFDGRHSFRLTAVDAGIRVEHSEEFKGILPPLVLRIIGARTAQGFEAMNLALKERAEAA